MAAYETTQGSSVQQNLCQGDVTNTKQQQQTITEGSELLFHVSVYANLFLLQVVDVFADKNFTKVTNSFFVFYFVFGFVCFLFLFYFYFHFKCTQQWKNTTTVVTKIISRTSFSNFPTAALPSEMPWRRTSTSSCYKKLGREGGVNNFSAVIKKFKMNMWYGSCLWNKISVKFYVAAKSKK